MINWVKNHKEFIVFVLYASLTFSLLFFHENWRDEAQAWLIARDCSISELIDAMKYEGHFLLWYLILMPFAKSGFPYVTTNIISWLITCMSVWFLLCKAPFKFYIRTLLIFTFPFLYLYPVVSRCYCLIPLAVVLMSVFYKDRREKPLRYCLSIVLLLNTHIIMAGMVVVVFGDYLIELYGSWNKLTEKEKQKAITSIFVAVILMLGSVFPLFGCLSANKAINQGSLVSSPLQISEAFFRYPIQILKELYGILGNYKSSFIIIFTIMLITLCFELKTSPTNCLRIWLCVIWQCLIYALIFGLSLQRASTIVFIVLFYKWINAFKYHDVKSALNNLESKLKRICWVSLVLINVIGGMLFVGTIDIPHNYSNAHDIANYINNNLEENSIIINGSHVEFTTSIIPYVKKDVKFYHVPGKRYFTFTIWDNMNKLDITFEDIKKFTTFFDAGNKDKFYYIFCTGKGNYFNSAEEIGLIEKLLKNNILVKLYSTNALSFFSEDYVLYKLNFSILNNYK